MTGSLREQRPGYWQLRVLEATDPMTGNSVPAIPVARGAQRGHYVRVEKGHVLLSRRARR